MIDQRIAARRQHVRGERRRARLRRTVLAATLLGLVGALALIERSDIVALDEVRVTGIERLEDGDVVAAAGLELGTSTLRLRLQQAEERVAALPEVRSATARRLDPLTVQIDVVERRPELAVRRGNDRALVDRDGIVLAGDEDGLPIVMVADRVPPPGEEVSSSPALDNAHRAWRQLSGPLRADVVELVADGPDELTLVLRSGVEVRFGRADRVDEKIRALGTVLEDIENTRVAVIDVRAPSTPVVIPP